MGYHADMSDQEDVSPGTEELELRYVPLSTVATWETNPKLHDIGGICESITRYGFGDPPKFDGTLGALVYGNGRIEALEGLRSDGKPPPRGIKAGDGEHADDWLVPVIFGVDQASTEMAERFALDHNSLTLGPRFDAADVQKLWKADAVTRVARGWTEAARTLVVPVPAAQRAKTRRASPKKKDEKPPQALENARKCQERWQVTPGARYRVGPFWLACADATDTETLGGLFEVAGVDPEKAMMVFDPPPCASEVVEGWGESVTCDRAGWEAAVTAVWGAGPSVAYTFVEGDLWCDLKAAAPAGNMVPRAMLVWNQNAPRSGGGLWRPMHELVMWSTRRRKRSRRQRRHVAPGDVLSFDRSTCGHHPHEKPVDLIVAILQNDAIGGRRRAPVVDPMMGSASTLLAAARLDRGGLGVDVDPLSVAVALTRLGEELGEEPEAA